MQLQNVNYNVMRMFNKITLLILIGIFMSCNNSLKDKTFIGIEHEIYSHGSQDFETKIYIKNKVVFIEKRPISINTIDTTKYEYHEEIFKYKGKLTFLNDSIKIKVLAFNCEDCSPISEVRADGKIADAVEELNYKGLQKGNELILNNSHFKIN